MPSFQNNDVAPSCGGVFAAEVVFDGIGEDVSLAITIGSSVLL